MNEAFDLVYELGITSGLEIKKEMMKEDFIKFLPEAIKHQKKLVKKKMKHLGDIDKLELSCWKDSDKQFEKLKILGGIGNKRRK